jgi:hypothetical protein
MKWPGSTLTDSRSRYHGKNEREGRADPGQALRLMSGAGATEGNAVTVARRVCSSVGSGLQAVQACPGGGGIGTSVARAVGAQSW